MGNIFDRIIYKGPPFSPKCVPDCTPAPNDLRGNTCYKGKCVSLCPVNSTVDEDGNCICIEENAIFKDDNSFMNNDPSLNDGWGYCETEELLEEEKNRKIEKELEKELENNPDMTEEEKIVFKNNLKKQIEEKEEKEKERKKKQETIKFNPVSLFIDRTPKELDDRVKAIVKEELKKNPNMSDEELTSLISQTTINVIEELAVECEDEYKIAKTILSPKYGNGRWPTQIELEVLIDNKQFPWLKSQINQWPEEKSITTCSVLTAVKDKITLNNRCIYTNDYPDVIEECNVSCGYGTEIRQKNVVRQTNTDFPSIQPCDVSTPKKEFDCDTKIICKEDCKLEPNLDSLGEARCSKPCDSGDGPGEKTYKVKYVKASQGEPDDMGSCELNEEGKIEGEEYDVTVKCNKDKCPDCEIESKGPYKDNIVDYTGLIKVDDKNKIYTKCLLPKEDGGFEDIDCGGAEGGHNYTKGARAKYNMTYNITKDDYGVQSCTKGEDIIEEGCSVNAFDPSLNPIVGTDGKIIKGGGEECGNECILSDDYPEVVMVQSSEGGSVKCSKDCGGGLQRMRKVVKSKSDAPYCPCKNDESKCPYEEIPCNTQACIAPCVYRDGENTQHVQINDKCPGREGPNKDITWDTKKVNAAGGEGMWYDAIGNKYYERSHFVKKMRVPTIEPPIGKGLCYQGNKSDKTLNCPIEGTEKPIHAVWGPWTFANEYQGEGKTISAITPFHSNWTFPKINVVKVGATTVGLTVPGSGTVNWPSGGINKAVEEVKKMGHTLGKTVHYVQKYNGQIWLYKKGNASGTTSADTWEFQKGEEQNPNKGLAGEHCIDSKGLKTATDLQLPGKIYRREVIVDSDHDGDQYWEVDGGNDKKVIPYMRNDGINEVKEGTPANNMTEAECKEYGESIGEWGGVVTLSNEIKGCYYITGNLSPKVWYNTDSTSVADCSLAERACIQKGPGGTGYTRYCPQDVELLGEPNWEEIKFEEVGNQELCYDPDVPERRGKYTIKELEEESRRRFVRDSALPEYSGSRVGEKRILGTGSRKIYRLKGKTPFGEAKHGGLTAGIWHQTENFEDIIYPNNNTSTLNNSWGKWMGLIRN